MINQEKIDEWIREVEERPVSAPTILRYISNRLKDLSAWNEELQAENIELRSGRRVDEYETRIANLEYQLQLLRRQFGTPGEIRENGELAAATAALTHSLILYRADGRVLYAELDLQNLKPGEVGALGSAPDPTQLPPIHLLALPAHEELLFIFSTGRTTRMPVEKLARHFASVSGQKLNWEEGLLQEPRGAEQLAAVAPISQMTLYEACVQASRRGCVKRMMRSVYETHIANDFIGSGVKQQPDQTCSLTFAKNDDLLAMVTREGFMFTKQFGELPYAIEEALRLSVTDYVLGAFAIPAGARQAASGRPELLFITNTGKAVQRDITWIEPAVSFKTRGQALVAPARRNAGTRLVGAALVSDGDWGVALLSDGRLVAHPVADLLSKGALPEVADDLQVVSFAVFSAA